MSDMTSIRKKKPRVLLEGIETGDAATLEYAGVRS